MSLLDLPLLDEHEQPTTLGDHLGAKATVLTLVRYYG